MKASWLEGWSTTDVAPADVARAALTSTAAMANRVVRCMVVTSIDFAPARLRLAMGVATRSESGSLPD
jgi:hypothetical protein